MVCVTDNSNRPPLIVLGCGGHAVVLLHALRAGGADIAAVVDDDTAKLGSDIAGLRVIGTREEILKHAASSVLLVNGVGSVRNANARRQLFEQMKSSGYGFATVIHPAAVVAEDVNLAEGVQIMAGAVIQPRARIGANSIVNTRAAIDHDVRIGAHVHIAPGATICGDVTIGDECHIGAGATVIQGVSIAPTCVIGAGAAVVRDLTTPGTYCGVPAKLVSG